LGNIATEQKKYLKIPIKWYEFAEKHLGLTDPANEIPHIVWVDYSCVGEGLKGWRNFVCLPFGFRKANIGRLTWPWAMLVFNLLTLRAESYNREYCSVSPELSDIVNCETLPNLKSSYIEQWLKMLGAQERADIKADSEIKQKAKMSQQ
jgi:hypothetical protein